MNELIKINNKLYLFIVTYRSSYLNISICMLGTKPVILKHGEILERLRQRWQNVPYKYKMLSVCCGIFLRSCH